MLGFRMEHFGDQLLTHRLEARSLGERLKGRHTHGCELSGHKRKAPEPP